MKKSRVVRAVSPATMDGVADTRDEPRPDGPLAIVGIGASAGDLERSELLRHLPQVGITVEDDTRLALGQRAQTVRELLLKAGFDGSLVEIESHGERSLLRKTPDNAPEPRNRRVEITIR